MTLSATPEISIMVSKGCLWTSTVLAHLLLAIMNLDSSGGVLVKLEATFNSYQRKRRGEEVSSRQNSSSPSEVSSRQNSSSPSLPPFPAIHWWPSRVRSSSLDPHQTSLLSSDGRRLFNSTCAIVGSGHGLSNAGYGAEIDTAHFVVRVNRMPPRDHSRAADIGRRTDILVLNGCTAMSRNGGVWWTLVGGGRGGCNLHNRSDLKNCGFRAYVQHNNQRWEESCAGEHQNDLRKAAKHSWLPVGIESDVLHNAVFDMRGLPPNRKKPTKKPTTGLVAVVMAALSCASLRIYGFAGSKTVDGHVIDRAHDIYAEHALLARLAAHDIDSLAMSDELKQSWRRTNMSVIC